MILPPTSNRGDWPRLVAQAVNRLAQRVDGLVAGALAPFSVNVSFVPKPTDGETLLLYTFSETVTFPADFSSSRGVAGVNATASTVFTIYKNPTFTGDTITGGTVAGTVTYSTGGAFTFASAGGAAISFVAGDSIGVAAPGTADATATGSFTLRGAR